MGVLPVLSWKLHVCLSYVILETWKFNMSFPCVILEIQCVCSPCVIQEIQCVFSLCYLGNSVLG